MYRHCRTSIRQSKSIIRPFIYLDSRVKPENDRCFKALCHSKLRRSNAVSGAQCFQLAARLPCRWIPGSQPGDDKKISRPGMTRKRGFQTFIIKNHYNIIKQHSQVYLKSVLGILARKGQKNTGKSILSALVKVKKDFYLKFFIILRLSRAQSRSFAVSLLS